MIFRDGTFSRRFIETFSRRFIETFSRRLIETFSPRLIETFSRRFRLIRTLCLYLKAVKFLQAEKLFRLAFYSIENIFNSL